MAIKRRFSQRIGVTPTHTEFQVESMDDKLRTGLWNSFYVRFVEELYHQGTFIQSHHWTFHFLRELWSGFLKRPLDAIGIEAAPPAESIRNWFSKASWFEIYDFLEYCAQSTYFPPRDDFIARCNAALEQELAGYRFINKEITPITDASERSAIQSAIQSAEQRGLVGVRTHLASALSKLSDRQSPDYRNSIKESISAVESLCQLISQKSKATLGDALRQLEQKVTIHRALQNGFNSIYGYTSDEGGIRHAMLDEARVEFEDAKFMLVACSAFVNYLFQKVQKAGIRLRMP